MKPSSDHELEIARRVDELASEDRLAVSAIAEIAIAIPFPMSCLNRKLSSSSTTSSGGRITRSGRKIQSSPLPEIAILDKPGAGMRFTKSPSLPRWRNGPLLDDGGGEDIS
jgi:hypothetical protein